jgi:spore coat protein U-like protein
MPATCSLSQEPTGIASISNTGDGTTMNYTVQFKAPTSLAPGTYTDTVATKACKDSACATPVANSPQ